jgi:hypothetical protein
MTTRALTLLNGFETSEASGGQQEATASGRYPELSCQAAGGPQAKQAHGGKL